MPPKKAAATTAAKKATTKEKTTKRKAGKENPDVNAQEPEVPEKKVKDKPVKKSKTSKEEPTISDKKKIEPKQKKEKAGTSNGKKAKEVDDDPVKDENETTEKRVTKSRKAKAENSEEVAPVTTKPKKATAAKGKRSKKTDPEIEEAQEAEAPQEVEEASDAKKGRKRKAAPKTKDEEPAKEEPTNKIVRTNATSTNWETVDFTCDAKNAEGKASNFHITSWNVDGLRAWLKKGGLNIIEYDDPDIFCIQETKCSLEKLPDEVKNIENYETLWCSSDKEGYAGVGIATKIKPLNVIYGIGSSEHDTEGRCITVEYENFFLVNVYVPNAGRKLVTLPRRLEWNEFFKEHITKLDETKPVIICGDMNVAHTEIDLANPKTNTKNAGFTIEEREGMTEFLEDGYIDTFRKLYPDKEKAYTFWTYMAGARSKNVGWRLDYFITSERFMDHVCDNIIHSAVLGSDHCPVSLHFNV